MMSRSSTMRVPGVRAVPGITGTSAAFIDMALVLVMTLLSAVAALKMHEPADTSMEITTAGRGEPLSDTAPLAALEIFPDGVVLDDGGGRIPFDMVAAGLANRAAGEGPVAVCVATGVAYHDVRNILADVQGVLGPRTWVDCGDAP